MKWNDYKEVSPEPKDYGDRDYSSDCSPSSWAATGRDDNNLYIWEEVAKEKTPDGPNGGGNDDGGDDNGDGDDGGDNDPFGMHLMCSLPSLHLGALRNGQQMFPGHGGDEAAYGGFGASGRRQLQVPKPQRAQTFWHGREHERQVVQ
jgi:hypothetical protein